MEGKRWRFLNLPFSRSWAAWTGTARAASPPASWRRCFLRASCASTTSGRPRRPWLPPAPTSSPGPLRPFATAHHERSVGPPLPLYGWVFLFPGNWTTLLHTTCPFRDWKCNNSPEDRVVGLTTLPNGAVIGMGLHLCLSLSLSLLGVPPVTSRPCWKKKSLCSAAPTPAAERSALFLRLIYSPFSTVS